MTHIKPVESDDPFLLQIDKCCFLILFIYASLQLMKIPPNPSKLDKNSLNLK